MVTSVACIQKFREEFRFRLAAETINQYELAVKQLLNCCKKPFDEITSRDIRSWMLQLDSSGYKAVTVKTKLAGIKLFYRYCLEEELRKDNPVELVPFPFVEEPLPRYLQTEELEKLRMFVKERSQERALIEVLYATGIRVGELAGMKKEDINWPERIIHIPNGKRKKARIVLFTRSCKEHLEAYLDEREDDLPFAFINTTKSGPVCIRTVQLIFETYTKHLGIRLTPHTLRHTFAAHLALKGMPLDCIQVLLGHEGPHQTQLYARLYSHARKQKYDEWM